VAQPPHADGSGDLVPLDVDLDEVDSGPAMVFGPGVQRRARNALAGACPGGAGGRRGGRVQAGEHAVGVAGEQSYLPHRVTDGARHDVDQVRNAVRGGVAVQDWQQRAGRLERPDGSGVPAQPGAHYREVAEVRADVDNGHPRPGEMSQDPLDVAVVHPHREHLQVVRRPALVVQAKTIAQVDRDARIGEQRAGEQPPVQWRSEPGQSRRENTRPVEDPRAGPVGASGGTYGQVAA